MRSRLKDGGMTYIVWIAIGSMLLGYMVPVFFKQKGSEPWAIRVNNAPISYKTFDAELAATREYIALLRAQYGQFADYILYNAGITDPRSMAFRTLVTQELAKQALAHNGLTLHPDYITHKMSDALFVQQYASDIIPPHSIAADGTLDSKILRNYLQRRGISMYVFEQKIAEKVGTWLLSHAVDLFAYTPDYVIRHTLIQQQSKKGFSYVTISYKDFMAKEQQQKISDQEIKDFFAQENNRIKRYEIPEKRSGTQWEFTPDRYGIIIDDHAIEAYYEQHKTKEYIASPATIQIRQIVLNFNTSNRACIYNKAQELHNTVVQKPDMFATVARTHSDETESAKKGGLLDPFVRGSKDKIIERASFSLQEDNAISPILELPDQFVIVQRVAKESQTYKPLKEVRAAIEKQLYIMAFKDTFNKEVEELIKSSGFTDSHAFIKQHNGTKKSVTDIVASKKPLAKSLFALPQGAYGFYFDGDNGYIIRLDIIEPQHMPELATVEKMVLQDIVAKRAREAFEKEGNRLYGLMHTIGIQKAAADEKITFHTINPYTTQDTDRIKDIKAKGLDPMALLKLEHTGSVTRFQEHDILYIVQCISIEEPTSIDSQEQKNVENSLKQQQLSLFSNGYVASLYRDATIETSDIIDILEEENTI